MRKAVALVLAAAFVAALPSIASAKKRHQRHHRAVMTQVDPNAGSSSFVGAALHQIIVPLEVTFGPRAN
jgi:fatty-acid desaturase